MSLEDAKVSSTAPLVSTEPTKQNRAQPGVVENDCYLTRKD